MLYFIQYCFVQFLLEMKKVFMNTMSTMTAMLLFLSSVSLWFMLNFLNHHLFQPCPKSSFSNSCVCSIHVPHAWSKSVITLVLYCNTNFDHQVNTEIYGPAGYPLYSILSVALKQKEKVQKYIFIKWPIA